MIFKRNIRRIIGMIIILSGVFVGLYMKNMGYSLEISRYSKWKLHKNINK